MRSPRSKVGDIEIDGIENACTRNDLIKIAIASAINSRIGISRHERREDGSSASRSAAPSASGSAATTSSSAAAVTCQP
jgi:hypothetical protein